jgi:hypothetical protein
VRKLELKRAMFLTAYWVWCFVFFIYNIYMILDGYRIIGVLNGVVMVLCLFIAAMWIEELLNDH